MNIAALLTSAGINTGVSLSLISLYSILRKQRSLVSVYFGHKLAQAQSKCQDPFCSWRLVPSASWIVKAWKASEEELYAAGGVDAVVFLRAVVLSIRVFMVAAFICLFFVLPLNYYGQQMEHKPVLPAEHLDVFTIANVKEGSKCLWAHCLALYIVSCCTCLLLYFEYKNIIQLRVAHISSSLSCPSYFAIIVRSIPWVREESYSDAVTKFFTDFYSSSYLSHQMVYHSRAIQKLV
ncbi:hypothetical protein M569_07066, partial [Genlisea aurea]